VRQDRKSAAESVALSESSRDPSRNAIVATIGDTLSALYCFVSTIRPLNVAS
jgi:hypothetical protein